MTIFVGPQAGKLESELVSIGDVSVPFAKFVGLQLVDLFKSLEKILTAIKNYKDLKKKLKSFFWK